MTIQSNKYRYGGRIDAITSSYLFLLLLIILAHDECCSYKKFASGFISRTTSSSWSCCRYYYRRNTIVSSTLTSSSSSSGSSTVVDSTSMVRSLQHQQQQQQQQHQTHHIPIRTENGGYLHTEESKKKISLANKGRVPWNKGRSRSEEEKARIAMGVRESNRLRLMQDAAARNMTLEQLVQERDAEKLRTMELRQGRKTDAGGYLLTDETKQKISRTLKDRWRTGQVKRRDASTYARGKTGVARHTSETKQKISASLKAKWEHDETYRDYMTERAQYHTNAPDSTTIRQRISQTLKEKWKDPEFRNKMMEQMKQRKSQVGKMTPKEHRQKISQTMREKWQDPNYRQKALEGMAKRRGLTLEQFMAGRTSRGTTKTTTTSTSSRAIRPLKPKQPRIKSLAKTKNHINDATVSKPRISKGTAATRIPTMKKNVFNFDPNPTDIANLVLRVVSPIDTASTANTINNNGDIIHSSIGDTAAVVVSQSIAVVEPSITTTTTTNHNNIDRNTSHPINDSSTTTTTTTTTKTATASRRKKSVAKSLTITSEDEQKVRLREENTKLYQLLYGDEDHDPFLTNEMPSSLPSKAFKSTSSTALSSIFLNDNDDDDFDLDSYDPYGLDKLAKSRPPPLTGA